MGSASAKGTTPHQLDCLSLSSQFFVSFFFCLCSLCLQSIARWRVEGALRINALVSDAGSVLFFVDALTCVIAQALSNDDRLMAIGDNVGCVALYDVRALSSSSTTTNEAASAEAWLLDGDTAMPSPMKLIDVRPRRYVFQPRFLTTTTTKTESDDADHVAGIQHRQHDACARLQSQERRTKPLSRRSSLVAPHRQTKSRRRQAMRLFDIARQTVYKRFPQAPLGFVSCISFATSDTRFIVGNARGNALLFRKN